MVTNYIRKTNRQYPTSAQYKQAAEYYTNVTHSSLAIVCRLFGINHPVMLRRWMVKNGYPRRSYREAFNPSRWKKGQTGNPMSKNVPNNYHLIKQYTFKKNDPRTIEIGSKARFKKGQTPWNKRAI